MERLIEALRELCPDCKTPDQNGNRNGYTCPKHWPAIYGRPMPTISELQEEPA